MASTLGDMIVKIVADATQFNNAIDASEKKMIGATKTFEKLGKNLTAFVTVPILGIGAASIKAAGDMEMQQAAFETMLGSADKAKKLLFDLNDLAASTPFQMTDLADATKTMLAFGISNEKVLPNLKMLGDIAGGNSDKLKSLTLAFSQIQSTGRLMGQDLLQLINSGFNPLSIIAEKTGKTMAVLKKEMEQGAISADMVTDAFETATQEGGLFFGGMERASLTFNGLMSTLVDNVVMLGRSIGDEMLPKLKEIVSTLTAWVGKFTALDSATKQAIIQYGLLAASIGPVILIITKLIQVIPTLKLALAGLAANPIILAMLALGAAIAIVAVETKKAATQAKAMKDALSGAADLNQIQLAIAAKAKEIELQKTLITQLESNSRISTAAVDVQKRSLEVMLQERRVLTDNYNGKQANIRATEELAAIETKRVEAELLAAKKAMELSKTMTTEEVKVAEDNLKLWEDIYEARLKAQADALGDAIVAEAKALDEIEVQKKRLHAEELARIEAEKQARIASMTYAYGQIQDIMNQAYSNEIANIENSVGTEEEKAKKIAEVKRKQAIWDKATALTDAAINTSVAITKALTAGPIIGPILASIIGGLGIAQGIAIAARPIPPLPLAEGGIVMPQNGGTLAQIAEAGQPEAVIPLDKLNSIGGDIHLVVQLDSKPFLDKIFPATRNRTILISAGAIV